MIRFIEQQMEKLTQTQLPNRNLRQQSPGAARCLSDQISLKNIQKSLQSLITIQKKANNLQTAVNAKQEAVNARQKVANERQHCLSRKIDVVMRFLDREQGKYGILYNANMSLVRKKLLLMQVNANNPSHLMTVKNRKIANWDDND